MVFHLRDSIQWNTSTREELAISKSGFLAWCRKSGVFFISSRRDGLLTTFSLS